QDLVVEGLAHTQYESALAPPAGVSPSEDELPTIDLPLIMPDDVRQAAPPAAPATPAAVVLSDDDGAADTAALSRAEPVVTETMADLYLKQGHPEEALRVYQALLTQRPDDSRLHARVDALSPGKKWGGGRETGESVPMFLKRILAGRPQAAVAASPLERAFAVAPPEAPRQPDEPTLGEASRPAEDTISLDQVFGDEGSRAPAPVAEPPAPNPPASAPPTPGPSATGGFSFD